MNSQDNSKPTGRIPLKLVMPRDISPAYSNLVRIAHSPAEFIFDFSSILPGDQQAKVISRILMNPVSAKLLSAALSENINRYESNFGEIKLPKKPSLADHLFKDLTPPEESPEE